MRALVQRVSEARVRVDGAVVGEIGPGLCVLVGVTHGDDQATARRLADKVWNLRVFPDQEASMQRSLVDVGGSALVVMTRAFNPINQPQRYFRIQQVQ